MCVVGHFCNRQCRSCKTTCKRHQSKADNTRNHCRSRSSSSSIWGYVCIIPKLVHSRQYYCMAFIDWFTVSVGALVPLTTDRSFRQLSGPDQPRAIYYTRTVLSLSSSTAYPIYVFCFPLALVELLVFSGRYLTVTLLHCPLYPWLPTARLSPEKFYQSSLSIPSLISLVSAHHFLETDCSPATASTGAKMRWLTLLGWSLLFPRLRASGGKW
jgi:hypothetical protein